MFLGCGWHGEAPSSALVGKRKIPFFTSGETPLPLWRGLSLKCLTSIAPPPLAEGRDFGVLATRKPDFEERQKFISMPKIKVLGAMVNYFFRVLDFAMISHIDFSLFEPFLRMSRRTGRRWGALRWTFLIAAAPRFWRTFVRAGLHRRIAAPRVRGCARTRLRTRPRINPC